MFDGPENVWKERGVPTPDCPGGDEYCTLCESGNYELELELDGSQEEDEDPEGPAMGPDDPS
jgi:hypothetical protein